MPRRSPLPPELREGAFDRATAERFGVGAGRLRDKDILRPYRGVQATSTPASTLERCLAYAVRLRPGQLFSHVTAAQLLGLSLPERLAKQTVLDVSAVHPAHAPSTREVRGHRLRREPARIEIHGLPVCGTLETWCQLASLVQPDDLVVIADRFLTDLPRPEQEIRIRMEDAITVADPRTGPRLRQAMAESRRGSASPGETRLRLLLVRAGLPEPELNAPLYDEDGRYLGKPDLVYREQRVVFEYEGDGHRERRQFRYDIERYERFRDAGWTVVRVTGDDLVGDRRERLLERARARLRIPAGTTSSGPPAAR